MRNVTFYLQRKYTGRAIIWPPFLLVQFSPLECRLASLFSLTRIRFGDYALDCALANFAENGAVLKLQPQPTKVLSILVNRAGEVVTREELVEQVWGSDTYVDFEHGLELCHTARFGAHLRTIRKSRASLRPSRNGLSIHRDSEESVRQGAAVQAELCRLWSATRSRMRASQNRLRYCGRSGIRDYRIDLVSPYFAARSSKRKSNPIPRGPSSAQSFQ